jgi:hypothetical protein
MSTGRRFHIWKTMWQAPKISREEARWVEGTFRVKEVHRIRRTGSYRLVGEVSAPDLPPTMISYMEGFHSSLDEVRGMELPVLVDRARPSRIRIQISDVHQYVQDALHERSRREAEPYEAIPGPRPYAAVIQALRSAPPMDAATFACATPAIAVVTAVVDELAKPPNPKKPGEPIAVLTLEFDVSPPDGDAPYPARCVVECRSEERRVQLSTPGTRIPVRIHPDNPARVSVDEEKLKLDRRQQT